MMHASDSQSGGAPRKIWLPIVICCLLIAGVLGGVVAQVGTAAAAPLSWSIIPSPATGTLNSVSCTSSTFCIAVGTEIESWDGTAWTVVPSPSPSGSTGSGFYGVSCLSATNCTAVGYSYNGTDGSANYQTLIESWDGTAWSITPSPTPSGGGFVTSCCLLSQCYQLYGGGLLSQRNQRSDFDRVMGWNVLDDHTESQCEWEKLKRSERRVLCKRHRLHGGGAIRKMAGTTI